LHAEIEEVLNEGSDEAEVTSSAPLPDFLRDDYDPAQEDNTAISPPDFHFKIDGMGSDSMAILFAESELRVLDMELDNLLKEIRSTRQALELKHADKELLTARAQSLRTAFDITKSRRAELRGMHSELPLKRAMINLEKQEAKLEKLKEVEKQIDESVFEEEKNKLLVRIKSLRKELKEALKESKKWLKSMKSETKRLKKEKSRLEAKLRIGDISQTAYNAKLKEIERAFQIIDGGKESLAKLVDLGEKTKK
jgi:chromosome segregation ATPase